MTQIIKFEFAQTSQNNSENSIKSEDKNTSVCSTSIAF